MTVSVSCSGGSRSSRGRCPGATRAWSRRHAASLVKLLALSPGRRLHREQVIEALWPGLPVETPGPRLHKAAHYARRALGDDGDGGAAQDMVALLPDRGRPCRRRRVPRAPGGARGRLGRGSGPGARDVRRTAAARRPLRAVGRGGPRARAALHLDLLRLAGVGTAPRGGPADEEAHLRWSAASAGATSRGAAPVRADGPGAAPRARHARRATRRSSCARSWSRRSRRPARQPRTKLFGRRTSATDPRAARRGRAGTGTTLLSPGRPASASPPCSTWPRRPPERGWRTGRGTASAVEGPGRTPRCSRRSATCAAGTRRCSTGSTTSYRHEIERALSGRDVTWSGESGHQRLFVAAAELIRLAAAGHGLLLVVDDLHEADEASLRLLHYLSRCAVTEPVVIAVAHRPGADEPVQEVAESLVARGDGRDRPPAARRRPPPDGCSPTGSPTSRETADEIWAVSGGLPFTVLELGSAAQPGNQRCRPAAPGRARQTFQRVALLGSTFTHRRAARRLRRVRGRGLPAARGSALRRCWSSRPSPATGSGTPWCARRLLEQMSPRRARGSRREVAERLAAPGAPPARVAHLFLAAGLPSRAVPYVLRAVETAGALGAYRDGSP